LSGLLAKAVFSIRLFHSVILENIGINLLCFLDTIAWRDFEKISRAACGIPSPAVESRSGFATIRRGSAFENHGGRCSVAADLRGEAATVFSARASLRSKTNLIDRTPVLLG
jgi:hypothetical protein